MNWVRRVTVGFLALLLLLSLIGGAQAVSANIAFRHPDKVESWLEQSKFYDHLVDNALDEAQKDTANLSSSLSVSFKDSQVRDAAKSTFTPDVLKKITKQVLDANYAWLSGDVQKPSFNVDLTKQKQEFADKVGKNAETYLNGLPVCTAQQMQQLQNELTSIDPFALPCRPPNVTAALEGQLVTQELVSSKAFLDVPVLTADSSQLNPNNSSTPYYQHLSQLPKLYQLEVNLPWIYGLLGLISLVGIIVLSQTRRKAYRKVGVVLIVAGLFLIAIKLVGDSIVNKIEERVFNQSTVGPLQVSLTDFMHFVEHQITKVDFLFGLVFLILGIILTSVFFVSRDAATPAKRSEPTPPTDTPNTLEAPQYRPPQPPKKPRLIQ